MDAAHIATLLAPFLPNPDPTLIEQLQRYLELLLRWNSRTNLTSVRDPEAIASRHFGESLFAARVLFGENLDNTTSDHATSPSLTVADVGSGAGFPGIPLKLFAPEIELTLIESQNKKATFLREAIRTLSLHNAEVFQGRAEQWGRTAGIVTLRAVERFDQALPVAASLVAPDGRLCLLIGESQIESARSLLGSTWQCSDPHTTPGSSGRVVLVAQSNSTLSGSH
jgi:16S rRNA (guanine527-N7)-methyltransferase